MCDIVKAFVYSIKLLPNPPLTLYNFSDSQREAQSAATVPAAHAASSDAVVP
jgi:hypothetical protein